MASKQERIYMGRRGRRAIAMILVFALAVLVVALALFFDSLQKFVVYRPDGLDVEMPVLASAGPGEETASEGPEITGVEADIVVADPSFDDIEAVSGEGLSPIRALYIPAESMVNGELDSYVNLLENHGANALIIETKPESGRLIYASGTYGATAFDTTGSMDLAEALSGLKERGIYLIAGMSCCVDELYATRNAPVSLRDKDGAPWADGAGRCWLDARNRGIRSYLTELIAELAGMGFDEIMLTNIAYPAVDADDSGPYPSEDFAAQTSVQTAVGNLAVSLAKARGGTGIRISALCPAAPDARSGQDTALFLKVFDRLYCPSSSGALDADRSVIEGAMTSGDISSRFVPVMAAAAEGGSWTIAG